MKTNEIILFIGKTYNSVNILTIEVTMNSLLLMMEVLLVLERNVLPLCNFIKFQVQAISHNSILISINVIGIVCPPISYNIVQSYDKRNIITKTFHYKITEPKSTLQLQLQ